MKTIKKQTILTLSVFVAILIGCTNKNDDSLSTDKTNGTITQGNWKVEYFNDSGSDETYKFNGYTFTFGSNGTLTATNGSVTQTGTWSTGNDDSQVKLYLTFSGASPFDEITDDWHVTEQSSSIIKLEDVSGGNGGTDYLNFSKI
jgi:major membrane immunogen (membrane-anchored lipoprotein)